MIAAAPAALKGVQIMTAVDAKKRGLLPMYSSHIWELLAAIKCLTSLQARRRDQKKATKLDTWLADFVQRLELLAVYIVTSQEDGIVYIRKSDKEMMQNLIQWVEQGRFYE